MIEQHSYPYIPKQHGIPFGQVPLNQEVSILGGSGTRLRCHITPRAIDIKHEAFNMHEPFYLEAGVGEDGTLSFAMQTRHQVTYKRHPDMFAAEFIGFSLEHFRQQGVEIKRFVGRWDECSDNYDTFFSVYDKKKNNRQEAASQTWTARVMARHGFTIINKVTFKRGYGMKYVEAEFLKEPAR